MTTKHDDQPVAVEVGRMAPVRPYTSTFDMWNVRQVLSSSSLRGSLSTQEVQGDA